MNKMDFVPVSWFERDEKIYDENDDYIGKSEYIIYAFGRQENGKSVTIRIVDYQPIFHIRIPSDWDLRKCQIATKHFRSLCPKYKDEVVGISINNYSDLHEHFCAGRKFKFMTFKFSTMESWKAFSRIFYNQIIIPGIDREKRKFETYEKKVDPFISFIHKQDLDSAGWNIVIDYEEFDNEAVTTDIFIGTTYTNVCKYNGTPKKLPPMKIMSYDIECISEDGTFPQAKRIGDKIVSICATINIYGSEKIIRTDILALDSTKRIKNANLQVFNDEKDLILAWRDLIQDIDPDFIIGFNIFGFDNKYVEEKANQPNINCAKRLARISRLRDHTCIFDFVRISSAGLGDNELWLHKIPGREYVDIMKLIVQDYKFDEYSLSKCAENFMKSKVTTKLSEDNKTYNIICNTDEVAVGNYVKFEVGGFMIEQKIKVSEVYDNYIVIPNELQLSPECKMCLAKDDMGPQELFDSFPKGPDERRRIHQYCIQDCALVNKLCHRRDFITQRMALASVSSVPFNFIIMKGQGIKALSLFAKFCKNMGETEAEKKANTFLIRDLKPEKNLVDNGGKVGYEGATVLVPITGFYKRPLTTLDFNSLYPSVECAWDMSHENLVTSEEFMNIEGYHYRTIEYRKTIKVANKTVVTDEIIKTTFATKLENINDDELKSQKPGKIGIVGTILTNLLTQRKIAKKNMKKFPNESQIYDGQQKALKVTANSIYGQLGSGVTPVSCIPIAAATTAGGRLLLKRGQDHMEQEFKPITKALYDAWENNDEDTVNKILDKELEDRDNTEFILRMRETLKELYDTYDIFPIVAYGDTDSNFNDFKITNKETGIMPENYWVRCMCMKLGEIAEKLIKCRLPYPNNLAYEKVIQPIALMAKKNYLGYRYEETPDVHDFMIMGFKLKRRDGSIVFQKVVGSAISKALDDMDPDGALIMLKQSLADVIDGKYPISDFQTSTNLKAKYKGKKKTTDEGYDPEEAQYCIDNEIEYNKHCEDELGLWNWWDVKGPPAHVKLCQRMRERDPGNVPQMNTRIPYAYVVTEKTPGMLQSECIEHTDYINEHNLKIDYLFYITNQIRNPATQFFELISDEIHDIFDEIVANETENNDNMFYEKRKNDTKKDFKQYGYQFDSDTDDEDANDAIEAYISSAIKSLPDSAKKKKVTKKTSKKNITGSGSSITKSIINNNIIPKFND